MNLIFQKLVTKKTGNLNEQSKKKIKMKTINK